MTLINEWSCQSSIGTAIAVPEVVRVLVELKAVPIVNRLLVQLNAVPGDNQVLVQLIGVPEVDYQKSIDFWYSTAIK